MTKDLEQAGSLGELDRPPRHIAKDALGAVVTLAIIGAILLQVTDGLAIQCRPERIRRAGPGGCSGPAAFAHHAQAAVTLGVAACAALAVMAFIWYIFWGYKANGQTKGTGQAVSR